MRIRDIQKSTNFVIFMYIVHVTILAFIICVVFIILCEKVISINIIIIIRSVSLTNTISGSC